MKILGITAVVTFWFSATIAAIALDRALDAALASFLLAVSSRWLGDVVAERWP